MENNKEKFITLLKSTKREGIESLIEWLETTDFYKAPASTKYHSNYEGGLLQHSLNVYYELERLTNNLMQMSENTIIFNKESIILVALLHDLCKTNIYKIDYRNTKNEYGKDYERSRFALSFNGQTGKN